MGYEVSLGDVYEACFVVDVHTWLGILVTVRLTLHTNGKLSFFVVFGIGLIQILKTLSARICAFIYLQSHHKG